MHKNNEICRNKRTICARKTKGSKRTSCYFAIRHKKEETEYEKESKEVI